MADAHERDAEFQRVHAAWFVRLELDRPVADLVSEHELIPQLVARCVVRRSVGQRKQSVELFVQHGAAGDASVRTLVIAICSETLIVPGRCSAFLRRELLKIADMLDESFGYSPALPALSPSEQNLIRDRYRVLWDIYVERRLADAGHSPNPLQEKVRSAFVRAFTFRGSAPATDCFDQVWEVAAATHGQLLSWSINPESLPGWTAGDDPSALQAGRKCPLCGFPTYDWFTFGRAGGVSLAGIIRDSHPNWTTAVGACRQCVETYEAVARALPSSLAANSRPADSGAETAAPTLTGTRMWV
jgi:hypothetical protein